MNLLINYVAKKSWRANSGGNNMRNILILIEQYEVAVSTGCTAFDLAQEIYKEMISDGFLAEELAYSEDEVQDILLIDYAYEFVVEDALIQLSKQLNNIAIVDRLLSSEEYEVEDEVVPNFKYLVITHNLDLEYGVKKVGLIPLIFNSLKEVNEFAEGKAHYEEQTSATSLYSEINTLELMATEDAYAIYPIYGVDLEVVADNIPLDSVAVTTIFYSDRGTVKTANILAVYEVQNYEDLENIL